MTAETFNAVVRPASGFSTEKKKGGSDLLDADAVTALKALDATNTASDVLDILSANQKRGRAVSANTIGRATSVLAT